MNATLNAPSTTPKLEPYKIDDTHAGKLWSWLQTRGGVFIWKNADMGDRTCGKTVCTPALTETGEPMGAPHWKYTNKPDRHITDPADIVVSVIKTLQCEPLVYKKGHNDLTKKCEEKLGLVLAHLKACHPKAECWYNLQEDDAVFSCEADVLPIRDYMAYRHANHES